MPKKLTIEFIRSSFEKEGYNLLAEEYVNSKEKLECVCSKGHRSEINWNGWQQGHRCVKCAGLKKFTIEFVKREFEKEGYVLLSKKYKNNSGSLKYICSKGHIGSMSFSSWQQGRRCNECAGRKRHTIDFIKRKFENEEYVLLTKNYINAHIKLKYICSKGHVGEITWNAWQQGQRCAKCGGTKKLTIGFINSEFEKIDYILLTKKYINCKQKLKYICNVGHVGTITWASFKNGIRCADCVNNKKLTILFIQKQFEKNGYKLLTKKYINRHQRLEYICSKNHYGTTSWSNWLKGTRCRMCYIESNKGKNHYNWNPNLTDEERKIKRNYLKYNEWCYEVKRKDNFTCQICGQIGQRLVSHHLESYNNNLNLRTKLSNGVCLCESCHKNFHHQYGYGNNTIEQFIEFINRYNKQEKSANV